MREILFRGKDFSGVINHSWCFGSLDTTEKDRAVIIYLDRFGNKCRVFVNPDTVGQYTGLTDKNGVKIFEGDIVHFKTTAYHFKNCRIKYQSCYARYCAIDDKGYEYPMDKAFEYEVIGNIYDNPELLRSVTE